MGRRSNYSKVNSDDMNPQEKADKVKEKINNELLTTTDIADYLNVHGNIGAVTKRTIENYLKNICDSSSGLLSLDNFKINGKYKIQPEYHGLLFTLLDTEYFDGRKNKRQLLNREELYSLLIKNIDTYLSNDDKAEVLQSPAYINALLEGELTKRISNEINNLIRFLYHTDPIIRYKLMVHTLGKVSNIRKEVSDSEAIAYVERHVSSFLVSQEYEQDKEAQLIKAKLRADSLEEYIIQRLAEKVHYKKNSLYLDDEEILGYGVIYAAGLFYQAETRDEKIQEYLSNIDEEIYSSEHLQNIQNKAKEVFDLENPLEKIIYNHLIRIAQIYLVAPNISEIDYLRMREMINKIIQYDKWDILQKFNE
ncbi:hypothetical protein [Paenibacillus taichungensis]|uniref:hypothetical protein n=1 Tax=Paenibacillus taichungensis TaxID=484184 RepID=UPI002870FB63|nr:hypothetical protein [Paenibacillus taichungensis]MDR9749290.1 hypothetical protein [Paenibacillus taichungensis]